MDHRPIGVFDSGLGGLTAVRELMQLLQNISACLKAVFCWNWK